MARVVVELLAKTHDRSGFDCGVEALNDFLRTKARKHAEQGISVTWVAAEKGASRILGFVTLTMGSVAFENADPVVTKGLPRYPIPMLHVGRLATDLSVQGRGIGSLLLRLAAERAIDASREMGCFGMELVAGDRAAYDYYLRRGFKPLVEGTMRLYLPIAHLRANDDRQAEGT